MINTTVGNYRVLSLLGEGGMGVVYLAQHPGIGRKAAIKVLHPDLARNPEVVTRFFNEARAANAIRHPGIVEVFDFGTLPDGSTYITMELLDGESLSARIKRVGRLRIGDAVELASQTANVLAAAHAAGIVHRDLKPDNLFLVPDPHAPGRDLIKVLDFGIAKLSGEASGTGSVKTRTGTIMGTPIYMSPEQCRGTKEVDHRTDIYALGVILYEMICGQPPFVSQGHGELIHMHIGVPPRSPRAHEPGIPVELEKVMLRLLAKDADERQQSMGEVQQALKASPARTEVMPQAERTSRMPSTPPAARSGASAQTTFSAAASMIEDAPPARRRWGVAAVVGALVVAGGAAAFVLGGGHLPRSSVPATTSGAAQTTPAPSPPPARPPAAPEAPASISVGIASVPAGARLVREKDGANIGVTPFKEAWPRGDGAEKMTLELDGYRPEPFAVPLERGVELTFTLTKLPAAAVHKHPHPTPTAKPEPRSEPVPL